jgi:carboxypeptidase Taq
MAASTLSDMPAAMDGLLARYQDIDALKSAISFLNWDRQVLMPAGGTEARSAHVSLLSRMAHEMLVSDETRDLMEQAARDASSEDETAMVRAFRRDFDVAVKLPVELVEEKSRVSSDAYEVWKEAKASANFKLLAPYLKRLFEIAGETAEAIGYQDHIYDPLIDLFEEGATYATAREMFDTLKPQIVSLVREIAGRPPIEDGKIYSNWDPAKLLDFAQHAIGQIGFDFDSGRIDRCSNAFCTHMATLDVRMTTRHSESVTGIIFSSLHEMGHGLYEQCSPPEWDRTPLAGGISLGVHESQSRLWENIVGRSRPFWSYFMPALQARVPELAGLSSEHFYQAINKIKPSFVRIGSDELTYNLHILIRFELEVEILTGQVAVEDLPDAWNAKMQEYLGITPPDDSKGVLQDVHWSRGSVGYFPTYTMGNLIGWQMWSVLQKDLGDTDSMMAEGRFASILEWLTEKVYRQGRRYQPSDLVMRVTGEPMKADAFVQGMRAKFTDIYGLA